MTREVFLERVRSALGTGAREPVDPDAVRTADRSGERDLAALGDRFVRELEEAGGRVHRASGPEEARGRILALLQEQGAKRVVRGKTGLLGELDVDPSLRRRGVELTLCDLHGSMSRDRIREAELVADVGLSSADLGVAETGTLILLHRPGQGRGISLLPPVHLAVLAQRDLVSDLGEALAAVEARGGLPSALTMITGPSRTGDIELVLTVGVHGPKELHVILLP